MTTDVFSGRPGVRRAETTRAIFEANGLLIFVLCAGLAAPLFVALRPVSDTWLAVAAGRYIVSHGLPHIDEWTIWGRGHRWVDQQWLAQLAYDGMFRLGGLRLIAFVSALAAEAAVVTAAVAAKVRGASARASALVTVVALVPFTLGAMRPRPQSLAYLPFVLIVLLLSADSRRPSRRVLLTLPILILWANLHGSVTLGAALVSVYGLLEVRSRRLVGLTLAVAPWLCVCASPYAAELPGYYRVMLTASPFAPYVSEWQPTTLSPLTVFFFALAAGAVYLVAKHPGVLRRSEALILALTAVAGLLAVRNIVWFALAAMLLLPRLLDRSLGSRVPHPGFERLLGLAATIGTAALLSIVAFDRHIGQGSYPAAAADAAAAAAGEHGRVFTTETYADWLMFEHPELRGRISYDARFELFPAARFQALSIALTNGDGWRDLVRGYRLALLERRADAPLIARIRGAGGRIVFQDANVIVLEPVA